MSEPFLIGASEQVIRLSTTCTRETTWAFQGGNVSKYTQFEHTNIGSFHIKHKTLTQIRINAGTASLMVDQYYTRVGFVGLSVEHQ